MQRDTSQRRLAGWQPFALVVMSAAACSDGPTAPAVTQDSCTPDGSLSVAVHGDVRGKFHWHGNDLSCEGMPRPGGEGARLRFSATLDDQNQSRTLAFIIGLPELERGLTAAETPARVTFMEENSGRFFSTAEADVCWSDVLEHKQLGGDRYAISGRVYCVAPVAELNGTGGVTLSDLEFRGRIDWGSPR